MLIDLINHQEYIYEVWLCKPYFPYEVIGYVDAINLTYKAVFNDDDDSMSFDAIYHHYDNQVNEVTKKLIENSILLVITKIDDETISQKYFIVNKAIEYGADQEKKKVSAMALESTLGNKTINGFKGTRKLYDGQIFDFEDHTKGGILDYINQYKLNSQWTIQMSPSLENIYMTVDLGQTTVYAVIGELRKIFNCVILFDNFNSTITIKTLDECNNHSGLLLSDTVMKSIEKNLKVESTYNRIYPLGKNDTTIVSVNPTGKEYIDDLTFHRNLNYMDQDLLDSFNTYDSLLETKTIEYNGLFSQLSTKQYDLSVLQSQLVDLQTDLTIIENSMDSAIRLNNSTSYNIYMQQRVNKNIEINNKQIAINSKQSEIDSVKANITIIHNQLSYTNNFTPEQLRVINDYIKESFVSVESDEPQLIYDYAKKMLEFKSIPSLEFEIDSISLFDCQELNYTWDKINLGDLVTVLYDGDFKVNETVRLVGYEHNIDSNPPSLKLYFNTRES